MNLQRAIRLLALTGSLIIFLGLLVAVLLPRGGTPGPEGAGGGTLGVEQTPRSEPGAESPLTVEQGAERAVEDRSIVSISPSLVTVEKTAANAYRYLVNGKPQVFIGMGYNPIYRDYSDEERAAKYDQDFRILCEAGVNHILGWDRDKGYDQDKFDELTLDYAHKYGIGVVMPFYLRALNDYRDPAITQDLIKQAAAKIERFKNHPALRMWGVGNEVMYDMPPGTKARRRMAFGRFFLRLADMFHKLDPDHPVIYREAEDYFIPTIRSLLSRRSEPRPWLLYGMNIYTDELQRILEQWPSLGLPGPLIVSEFGAPGAFNGERGDGYLSMWRTIRAYPDHVLGGAPYVWTTAGPEPTDTVWGLMDRYSNPVDDAFEKLAGDWRTENSGARTCPAPGAP